MNIYMYIKIGGAPNRMLKNLQTGTVKKMYMYVSFTDKINKYIK